MRIGGLRAGWAGLAGATLTFDRYSYVPGVTVSGKLTSQASELRIGGAAAAHGTLRLGPHKQARRSAGWRACPDGGRRAPSGQRANGALPWQLPLTSAAMPRRSPTSLLAAALIVGRARPRAGPRGRRADVRPLRRQRRHSPARRCPSRSTADEPCVRHDLAEPRAQAGRRRARARRQSSRWRADPARRRCRWANSSPRRSPRRSAHATC